MTKSEEIRIRLAGGEAAKSIAAALGVSLRRVYQVRGERSREPIDAAKQVAIKSAVSGGMSQREAAAQFGCSRKTIAALCADLDDLPRPAAGSPLPAETVAHIVARHRADRSTGTIARELGLDTSTVRAVIRRNSDARLRPGDDIMQAIRAEMDRRGLTAYGLAQLVSPPPTQTMLYEYLRGEKSPTTPVASRILESLGLEIRRKIEG